MTIRFLNDWLRYPDAVMDWDTSNRSAVDLAAKLRLMGVENHGFMLALHNPELKGVDPFGKDLPQRVQAMIALEIKSNAWYYFREIARVPGSSGAEASHIEMNRANLALWWCFFCHIMTILTQPRQTGKSFSADHLIQYLMLFRCTDTQINLMTKDDKLRAANVERLKAFYSELPWYLQFRTKDDVNNTEEMSVKLLGNSYKTHVPQTSEKAALNAGRGFTTAVVQIDEGPFQRFIDISLPAALPAMGAAMDAAKRSGSPYGVIMTTTAAKKDSREGKYFFQKIIDPAAPWSDLFYDARDEVHLEEIVRANSRGKVYRIYMVFSHIQLGKDDAWMREKLENSTSTHDEANRDFFNIWTSGTSASPLPLPVMEQISKSMIEPLHQQIFSQGGYILRWYLQQDEIERYMATHSVVIGVDTSDAVGRDGISVVFTSAHDGRCVAAALINDTNLQTFAKWLAHMLERWQKTLMIVERRSSGVMVLDYLLTILPERKMDPFKRLFNWIVNNPEEHPQLAELVQLPLHYRSEEDYRRARKYFGFATSGGGQTSRSDLYSATLQNAAKNCGSTVFDRPLGSQILSLETRNGRVDHPEGEHDDLVIGWLLGHWVLTVAVHLDVYGIDRGQILAGAIKAKELSPEEQVRAALQLSIRSRINNLFDVMANEDNDFMLQRYEQELRQLDRQLILQDDENFSMDMYLHELKEKRRQKRSRTTAYASHDRHHSEQFGYANVSQIAHKLPPGTIIR